MDERIQKLLDENRAMESSVTAPAGEILEHLYQAVLAIPEFTLKDGTKARLKPYAAPEPNKDGEMQCGVDVLLDNGTHLEFTLRNSGWGKAFAPEFRPEARERKQRLR